MKSRQQNYRMQNAKIQTRQDIYGMKKTKYRKLTTYQQKCRKRPGVEATHGRSITNSRKPDIHEKQIKNFEENEIKAKISNGIWKFRTKFWNDSIKIYIGHVVHSSPTLDARDFSCAVSGFGQVLKSDPRLAAHVGRRRVGLRPTKLLAREKKYLVPKVI